MKRLSILIVALAGLTVAVAKPKADKNWQKNVAITYLDGNFAFIDAFQKEVWSLHELGFLEEKSSGKLQQYLADNGFVVEAGVAGMPTAFVATYGEGGPKLGVLAEFDALPGLSQDTVGYRKPIVDGAPGHGCGHNVFGIASAAGAVAVSKWLKATGRQGRVVVYGTPAEEGGGGKVYMAREHIFDDADAILDWHPANANSVQVDKHTAMTMVDFTFHGTSAHAAGAPWKGRSALDAVEAFDYMVNLLREHVLPSSRIHYVIADGGKAPNVVPDYARVSYYIRSPRRAELLRIQDWIFKAADGAALGTETTVDKEIICGYYEKLTNRTLQQVIQRNLELVGGVKHDDREQALAAELQATIGGDLPPVRQAGEVLPLAPEQVEGSGGSTDVGDVSWVVPNAGFGTAVFVPGAPGHCWQNVAFDGTTAGTKAAVNAAKVFALSLIELFTDTKLIDEARREFDGRRGSDFKYVPLLGDRAPALDYRKGL